MVKVMLNLASRPLLHANNNMIEFVQDESTWDPMEAAIFSSITSCFLQQPRQGGAWPSMT